MLRRALIFSSVIAFICVCDPAHCDEKRSIGRVARRVDGPVRIHDQVHPRSASSRRTYQSEVTSERRSNFATVEPKDKLGTNVPKFENVIGRVITGSSLAVMLGLVLLFATTRRRTSAGSKQESEIELISTVSLARNCSLTLVSTCGQKFLIARDPAGLKDIVPVRDDFEALLPTDFDASNLNSPSSLDSQTTRNDSDAALL